MARRHRGDRPGAAFHVMNRGIARRTIFDSPSDYRFFLACLARAVRREEIQVLAYALMRTHFHLFLRSLGGLSTAMRRIQLRHVRRFNRLHRRDGPLLRSRFVSKEVDSIPYGRNVVHYTHENPVLARLCRHPSEYPWSSAGLCASGRVPPWFSTDALERYDIDATPGSRVPSSRVMHARAELVEARLRARGSEDEGSALDLGTPRRVREWMIRKSELADGRASGLPQVGARTMIAAITALTEASIPVPGAGTYTARELLAAGTLRDVSCCGWSQIAESLEQSVSRVQRLARLHRRCMRLLPAYQDLAAGVVGDCIGLLSER